MGELEWKNFVKDCLKCQRCKGLLDANAIPLFMKNVPQFKGILFVLEAPNRDDTYDCKKMHITINSETDPTGRFFYDLFKNELKFNDKQLFVTNSVLCLPKKSNNSNHYQVKSEQRRNCSILLKRLIELFEPVIVCPLGLSALKSLSYIDDHPFAKMSDILIGERSKKWFKRYLYPLYHPSLLGRHPLTGRSEPDQRSDWRHLGKFYQKLI